MHKNIKTMTIVKHLLKRPLLFLQRILKYTHGILTTGIIGKCFFYLKWTCVILGILSVILIYYYNIKLQNYINLTQLAAISALSRLQIYLTQFVNYIVEYLGYDIKPDVDIPNETLSSTDKLKDEYISNIDYLEKYSKILESLRDKPVIEKGTAEYESLRDLYMNKQTEPESEGWFTKKTIYIVGGVIIAVTIGGIVYWVCDGSYETFANKFTDLTTGLIGFFVSSTSKKEVEIPDTDTEDYSKLEFEKKMMKLKNGIEFHTYKKNHLIDLMNKIKNLQNDPNFSGYSSQDQTALSKMEEDFAENNKKLDKLNRVYRLKTGEDYLGPKNSDNLDDQIFITDLRTSVHDENPEVKELRNFLEGYDNRVKRLEKEIQALEEAKINSDGIFKDEDKLNEKQLKLNETKTRIDRLSEKLKDKVDDLMSSFFMKLDDVKNIDKSNQQDQQGNVFNSAVESVQKIWSDMLSKKETPNTPNIEETSNNSEVNKKLQDDEFDSTKAWSAEHSKQNTPAQSEQGSRPSSPVASTSKIPDLNEGEETPATGTTPKTKPSDLPEDENPYFVTVEELKKQSYYNGKQYSIWQTDTSNDSLMKNLRLAETILKDSGLSESEKEDLESRLKNYRNLLSKKYREEDDSQKDFTPLHWNKAFKQPLIVENLPTIEPEKWSEEDELFLKKLLDNNEITEAQYNEIIEKCICLPSDETLEKYKNEHKQWVNFKNLFEIYKNLLNPKIDESNDCSEDANTSLISDTSTVVDDTSEIEGYDRTFKAIKSRDYNNVSYYFSDNNYFEVFDDVEMYKEKEKTNELNDPIKKVLEDKLKIIYEPSELQDILEYFKTDYFDEKNLKIYDTELFKNVYLKLKENNDIEEIPESVRNRAIELGIEQSGLITLFLSKILSKEKIKKLNKIENITEDQMNDIDRLLVMNHERILANLNLDQLNYYVELCKILDIEITKDMQHVLDCYKKDPEGSLKIHEMLVEFNERSNDLYLKKNVEIIITPLEEEVVLNYGNKEFKKELLSQITSIRRYYRS
jgi:hypothetical protein